MQQRIARFGKIVDWEFTTYSVYLKVEVTDVEGKFVGWISQLRLDQDFMEMCVAQIDGKQNEEAQLALPWD